jgi:hypothetical protein
MTVPMIAMLMHKAMKPLSRFGCQYRKKITHDSRLCTHKAKRMGKNERKLNTARNI